MCNNDSSLTILERSVPGKMEKKKETHVFVDGARTSAYEGEPVAPALTAHGIMAFGTTPIHNESRGVFCATGRCTDCLMTVNGQPSIRTCVTPVEKGMEMESHRELGKWKENI